ncbi:AraC family transcriptional regulator [Yeosuana marina]|uniref:AraC family transcriptional regulator n=1 Tax=Yeosuana marina TaxID=1565536 RepID=UPI0030C808D3
MEFIFDKIHVPIDTSFITKKLPLLSNERIHLHKNFELNYINSGIGRRIVGDNISSFEKGDLVLLGPNLPHCWELLDIDKNEEPSCIVTHFSEGIIDSDFFKMPELEMVVELLKQASRGIRFKIKDDTEIKDVLTILSKSKGLEYYIGLLDLFNNLIKVEDFELLSSPIISSTAFSKNVEKMNKVYEYVFQNIQEGIKLEEASAILNMSNGSFCRFFKKKTGITFMDYVRNIRIGIATKLLAETDKQITEICYESGYNNLPNFNHYFKISIGKTPSDYRKDFR